MNHNTLGRQFDRIKKHATGMTPSLKAVFICFLAVLFVADSVTAATALTVQDVRRMALEFNRRYLSAEEDVVKAQSEITTARAGALPDITVIGSYNRNIKLPSFFLNPEGQETIEFKAGFKNDFGASISLRQSIWKGGKVFKALKIANLYKRYAEYGREEVASSVVYSAELLFYQAILEQSNLQVLRRAFEANSYNLETVEKSFSQGLVSEFEVLRARVEKSNLLPQILAGESNQRLAEKRLKSFIGMDLEEEIHLVEVEDDTTLAGLPSVGVLTDTALVKRPEIQRVTQLVNITKNAVGVAKADYFPQLEAVSNYSWSAQSDDFTLSDNTVQSWSAGLNLTIPIFKGGETRGRVSSSRADYRQAVLAEKEARDAVKLEVEQAYDQMLQAKKTLDIQGVTIEQAEEGLRIANLRYQSGIGTLLEVLSAQTALTEASNNLALARFVFRQARAQLKKATTVDL